MTTIDPLDLLRFAEENGHKIVIIDDVDLVPGGKDLVAKARDIPLHISAEPHLHKAAKRREGLREMMTRLGAEPQREPWTTLQMVEQPEDRETALLHYGNWIEPIRESH